MPLAAEQREVAGRSQGLHAAIIMDGNGRWATARGLPRSEGHRRGAQAVRSVVEAAPELGIGTLTLYAFSSDNWQRPPDEVQELLRLFRRFLRRETRSCRKAGVRVCVIGRRDRLPADLCEAIARTEAETRDGDRLILRLAIDYSARDAIAAAAGSCSMAAGRGEFSQRLLEVIHSSPAVADVDLLIRTGGEHRLSDFLLWECAYAELFFRETAWPDFRGEELADVVAAFANRQRRFGALPEVGLPEAAVRATPLAQATAAAAQRR